MWNCIIEKTRVCLKIQTYPYEGLILTVLCIYAYMHTHVLHINIIIIKLCLPVYIRDVEVTRVSLRNGQSPMRLSSPCHRAVHRLGYIGTSSSSNLNGISDER